jgi:hypothetical protein
MLAHRLEQRDQRDTGPQSREDMHGKGRRPHSRRCQRRILLIGLVHLAAVLSGIAGLCTLPLAAFRRAKSIENLNAIMRA